MLPQPSQKRDVEAWTRSATWLLKRCAATHAVRGTLQQSTASLALTGRPERAAGGAATVVQVIPWPRHRARERSHGSAGTLGQLGDALPVRTEARLARTCAAKHEGPDRESSPHAAVADGVFVCGLTFELTPTAEAGSVSLVRENVHRTADQAYAACRSRSGVERGVRRHARRRQPFTADRFLRQASRACRRSFARIRETARVDAAFHSF
jgi:hypothetical protein